MTWNLYSARFFSERGVISLVCGDDGKIKISSISPMEFQLSSQEEATIIKQFAAHLAFDKNIREKLPDNQPQLPFKNPA